MPSERMRLWVALTRCPASLRLSIASSRMVSSGVMTEVYGQAVSPITRLGRLLPRARRLRTLEEEDANEGYMSASLHELRSGSAAARSCPKGYYERSFSSISSKLAARALDLSTLITTLSSALASILAIFRACFVSVDVMYSLSPASLLRILKETT